MGTEFRQCGEIVRRPVIPEQPSPGADQQLMVTGLKDRYDKIILQAMVSRPRIVMPEDLARAHVEDIQPVLECTDPQFIPRRQQTMDIVIGNAVPGGRWLETDNRLCPR